MPPRFASMRARLARHCACLCLALLPVMGFAAEPAGDEDKTWDARLQGTYIRQVKPPFHAPYSGTNSLTPGRESAYTFSSTAYLGYRPSSDLEFWFNPELVRGVAMSGLHGLAGFTNGEQQKTSGPSFTLYRARLFMRKTWSLGGEREQIEAEANQFAQTVGRRRFVLTVGNLAVSDIFDDNAYAHDARTQFMNWTMLAHGAWDFAADARGYTWGAAGEWYHDQWALRFGRFMQPEESNGLTLDRRILKYYGDQFEIEHSHTLAGREGKVRLLGFRNRANMGAFSDAIAAAGGGTPSLADVRRPQTKLGGGLSLEQALADNLGLFARASFNDGRTETYAFTEIDRSVSAGLSAKGRWWGRSLDSAGFALVRNGISSAHRDYLAAGGLGAFLGDGQLNYGSERILEMYYSLGLMRNLWLTLDLQHIVNPGYNRDRGAVSVGSLRLHFEM